MLLLSTLMLCAGAASKAAEMVPVVGRASVLDATVLLIDDHRIQIDGIAGPHGNDVCVADAAEWACGLEAKQALAERLGDEPVACDGRQRYSNGALAAYCEIGGEDVARWLVANGWALRMRRTMETYAEEENQARAAELGVWRGGFVPPNFWRMREDQLGCNVCAARKERLKKKKTVE